MWWFTDFPLAAAAGSHFSNLRFKHSWSAAELVTVLCVWCYSSQQDCGLSVSFILSQFSSSWLMSKWAWHYWTFTHSRNDRSASLFPLNKPRGSKVTVNPPPCSPVGDFRLHQQIEDDRQQVVGTHRLDTDCRGNTGNRQNNTCGPHTADTLPLSKPND